MAGTIEMMEFRDRNRATSADDGGLASRVSAAGYQVAQAADGLQQTVGLLRTAEELARDAETRRREAEDRLTEVQEELDELTDMLAIARSAQADAEERATITEERSVSAEERARAAEQRFAGVRGEIDELTERVALARTRQAEADERTKLADEQARLSDERARLAEDRFARAVDRTTAMELALTDLEDRWSSEPAQPVTVFVEGKRDELQEAFAAEIRRPLTSILGLTLALKHADTKANDAKHMVRQLGTNAKRLERLVEQMLDLDKIANGSYEPNRRRTDLEALVQRVAEETPDVANRDLKVRADHVAVEIDPALTEQIVETLLTNAGRRTAQGGKIWVTVVSEDDGAAIAVDDSGEEALPDMEGKSRSRSKRSDGAAGLPLVVRLAELHGGRAWVEAREGGGASFRVFLPDAPSGSAERATSLDLIEDVEGLPFDASKVEAGLRELASFDDLSDGITI